MHRLRRESEPLSHGLMSPFRGALKWIFTVLPGIKFLQSRF